MSWYLAIKTLHIISAAVLFGTGMGIAFFMLMAVRSQSGEALRVTAANVVRADRWFTAPAVVIQPVTGVWLMLQLGYPFNSVWFITVAVLYTLAGACWTPVIRIQKQMGKLDPACDEFRTLFRRWIALGCIAFSAVLVLFFLMVFRPGL